MGFDLSSLAPALGGALRGYTAGLAGGEQAQLQQQQLQHQNAFQQQAFDAQQHQLATSNALNQAHYTLALLAAQNAAQATLYKDPMRKAQAQLAQQVLTKIQTDPNAQAALSAVPGRLENVVGLGLKILNPSSNLQQSDIDSFFGLMHDTPSPDSVGSSAGAPTATPVNTLGIGNGQPSLVPSLGTKPSAAAAPNLIPSSAIPGTAPNLVPSPSPGSLPASPPTAPPQLIATGPAPQLTAPPFNPGFRAPSLIAVGNTLDGTTDVNAKLSQPTSKAPYQGLPYPAPTLADIALKGAQTKAATAAAGKDTAQTNEINTTIPTIVPKANALMGLQKSQGNLADAQAQAVPQKTKEQIAHDQAVEAENQRHNAALEKLGAQRNQLTANQQAITQQEALTKQQQAELAGVQRAATVTNQAVRNKVQGLRTQLVTLQREALAQAPKVTNTEGGNVGGGANIGIPLVSRAAMNTNLHNGSIVVNGRYIDYTTPAGKAYIDAQNQLSALENSPAAYVPKTYGESRLLNATPTQDEKAGVKASVAAGTFADEVNALKATQPALAIRKVKVFQSMNKGRVPAGVDFTDLLGTKEVK